MKRKQMRVYRLQNNEGMLKWEPINSNPTIIEISYKWGLKGNVENGFDSQLPGWILMCINWNKGINTAKIFNMMTK